MKVQPPTQPSRQKNLTLEEILVWLGKTVLPECGLTTLIDQACAVRCGRLKQCLVPVASSTIGDLGAYTLDERKVWHALKVGQDIGIVAESVVFRFQEELSSSSRSQLWPTSSILRVPIQPLATAFGRRFRRLHALWFSYSCALGRAFRSR